MKNRCHNYISPLSGGTSHEQICNTSPVWGSSHMKWSTVWYISWLGFTQQWFMKYVSPLQIWCEQLCNMVWSQNAAPASDFEALGAAAALEDAGRFGLAGVFGDGIGMVGFGGVASSTPPGSSWVGASKSLSLKASTVLTWEAMVPQRQSKTIKLFQPKHPVGFQMMVLQKSNWGTNPTRAASHLPQSFEPVFHRMVANRWNHKELCGRIIFSHMPLHPGIKT